MLWQSPFVMRIPADSINWHPNDWIDSGTRRLQNTAPTHGGSRWSRLRDRGADVHVLPVAVRRRGSLSPDSPRGSRGRAYPLRIRYTRERRLFRSLIKVSGVGPK